ncbi:MAG: hypothetical protein ABI969_02695 [bacterium]
MTTLARLLFPAPAIRRSPAQLLGWWESRRPTYNIVVGGTGVLTLAVLQAISWLPPHLPLQAPWQVVVAYGVLANVCYSFGYITESLLERLWGGEVAPVGPALFRQGLIFSVGLTLLPIGLAWIGYLVAVAKWLLS